MRRSAFHWWGAEPDHGTAIHFVERQEKDPALMREMEELVERHQAEALASFTEEDLTFFTGRGTPRRF